MNLLHDWKQAIDPSEISVINRRLFAAASPDAFSVDGTYRVHSLYFSNMLHNMSDTRESCRSYKETYRICYYNNYLNLIKLEKKTETGSMSAKSSCEVTREFVETILYRHFSNIIRDPMGRTGDELDPLIQEFYWKVVGNGLVPCKLVDYDCREFSFADGSAHAAITCNFRTSSGIKDFLNPFSEKDLQDGKAFLQIRWEHYLPETVKSAVQLNCRAENTGLLGNDRLYDFNKYYAYGI